MVDDRSKFSYRQLLTRFSSPEGRRRVLHTRQGEVAVRAKQFGCRQSVGGFLGGAAETFLSIIHCQVYSLYIQSSLYMQSVMNLNIKIIIWLPSVGQRLPWLHIVNYHIASHYSYIVKLTQLVINSAKKSKYIKYFQLKDRNT